MKLCIVIPVLNEEHYIKHHIQALHSLSDKADVFFVDGGSIDNTVTLLQMHSFNCLQMEGGRGAQLSAGLAKAHHYEHTIFLHVDSQLPDNFPMLIEDALKSNAWGRFNVKINSAKSIFKMIAVLMNFRSCLTGIATGDQAIFIKPALVKELLQNLDEYPLMEDIYMSRQLKTVSRPACIKTPVTTSSRYWEKHGVFKTILAMWWYRLLFFLGVSPDKLYKQYYS